MKTTKRAENEGQVTAVGLSGEFLERVDTVTSTTMSLVVCPGTLEESQKDILVPFIAVNFKGSSQLEAADSEEKLFSRILSIENASFVAADMIDEMGQVLDHLALLSTGSIKPDAQRLKVVQKFMQAAHKRTEHCLAVLTNLIEDSELQTTAKSSGKTPRV